MTDAEGKPQALSGLVPAPLFGVARSIALAHPGITTEEIYRFVKEEYPGLNPRWMRNTIGKARYAARHSTNAEVTERRVAGSTCNREVPGASLH